MSKYFMVDFQSPLVEFIGRICPTTIVIKAHRISCFKGDLQLNFMSTDNFKQALLLEYGGGYSL